jgi:hypothetical protein
MSPIRQRRAVPEKEVLAIFATAPVVNGDELRADVDKAVSQDLRDLMRRTGRSVHPAFRAWAEAAYGGSHMQLPEPTRPRFD